MKIENQTEIKEKSVKMKIPKNIQKEMLEFFMQTSIPRKKAKAKELPKKELDSEFSDEGDFF